MTRTEYKIISEWLKKASKLRANLVRCKDSDDYELILSCEAPDGEDELVIIGLPSSEVLI